MNTRKIEGDSDPRYAVEHPLPAGDGELEHGELEMDSRTMRKVIALVLTILEIESWENSVDN